VNDDKLNPPKLPDSIFSRTQPPTKDEVEFEMLVAQLVFILQDTEQVIRFCERIVFNRESAEVTTDVFRRDKRTLGELVKKLKQRTSLDSDFQRTLEAFVENRNSLIHRAFEQPWWKALNQDRFADAFAFLGQLVDQAGTVKLTFEAAIFDYMEKTYNIADDAALEPFKKSGYLDAVKAHLEFSRAAIKPTDYSVKTQLTDEQRAKAVEILESTRRAIANEAGGDPLLEFAIRRYIYVRLSYDERGKPIMPSRGA
jgi:hypothetical protein